MEDEVLAGVKRLPIIFFGVDRFPALPLERLLEDGYNVKAIFAAPDKDGRGGKKIKPVAKVLGEKYGVPVFQPEKGREILPILKRLEGEAWYKEMAELGVYPQGVLVSYGKMIPSEVLEWFGSLGILNIHPSLLPKYRGSSPVESAILNGDTETGVSIIYLVPEMDAGKVMAAKKIAIAPNETSTTLYKKAAETGIGMLLDLFMKMAQNEIAGDEQNHSKATFTPRFDKAKAELLPGETAMELDRKVRAFDANPKAFFIHNNKRFTVQEGVISETRMTQLDIPTSDGKFYSPKVVTPEGKKQMRTDDYLRGAK